MVQRITISPQGPEFSRLVMGYWRLMEWNMSPPHQAGVIQYPVEQGSTPADHAAR